MSRYLKGCVVFKKSSFALQSLLGNLDAAVRTFQNYYSVWRQFGGLPEFYSIPQGFTVDKREGYPLRPGLPPPRDTEDIDRRV